MSVTDKNSLRREKLLVPSGAVETRLKRDVQPGSSMEDDVLFLVAPMGTMWRSYPYIEPPYGASLVVGSLRRQGRRVTFVDLDLQLNHWQKKKLYLCPRTLAFLQDWRQLLEQLDDLPQDLQHLLQRMYNYIGPHRFRYVALSLSRLTKNTRVYDVEFGFALALAWFIKSSNPCPVILGGQIINKIGRRAVQKVISHAPHRCADFFFYGDGAVSLPILLQALENRKDFTELVAHLQDSNAHITWWEKPGKVATLGKRSKPTVQSVVSRSKCFLERDLLKIRPSFEVTNASFYPVSVQEIFHANTAAAWVSKPICIFPYKFMYGCSHRCVFCKSAYQALIVKPAVNVVDDLQYYIEKEGAHCFRFFNSQINYTRRYVEQFCNEIVRRGLKLCFVDSASLRKLDQDVCDMLREAGCVKLWFGLESPVPKTLKLIDKQLSLDEALAAIQRAHKAGIWIGMNIILGFPHESDEDFQQVCNFVESHLDIVDGWNFNALQVYEDTPMRARPADYGIQIHHHYRGKMRDKGFAFSEIGGLNWKALAQQAMKRVNHCELLAGGVENQFRVNDYLIFALYQEFGEKDLVKFHLRRFLDELKHSDCLAEGAKWITPNKVLGFNSPSFLERIESLP